MTNSAQIQRKWISLRAQPSLFLFASLNSVYSQNSEGAGPKGGVPPWNASRKLGDFPTCNLEGWCLRHLERTISRESLSMSGTLPAMLWKDRWGRERGREDRACFIQRDRQWKCASSLYFNIEGFLHPCEKPLLTSSNRTALVYLYFFF